RFHAVLFHMNCIDENPVPFPLLQGECVEHVERAEESVIALTSYRLHIKLQENVINVPLQLIESVECGDLTQMHLTCKDCKLIRCNFLSAEQCQDWLRRISAVVRPPARLEELFAFSFLSCSASVSAEDREVHDGICRAGGHQRRFKRELERMGFDTHSAWRVSNINSNYRLCASYPEQIIVPAAVTDQELESVAAFRSWKRIPAVVYRHQSSGAVIGRCGQPEVSWWGWRNADDEHLVQAIAKACITDRAANTNTVPGELSDSNPHTANGSAEAEPKATPPQKLLIMDARSYAAAVANRAKGGGCECPEYYPNCEVMFMGMANIHSIRKSFQSLRTLCAQVPDPVNWLSALEGTKWLQHLSLLLKASLLVVNALDRDRRPVLVHCSDGWDRTPQIVALSKLLLDPFYRTIQGFQVLVETEWLDYGHKFAERCGQGENAEDLNERCPVFLQWLDCVHQLQRQFPCSFQFNEAFLVHTVKAFFALKQAKSKDDPQSACQTASRCQSLLKTTDSFESLRLRQVLHPVCHVRNLMLWSAIYLPNSAPSTPSDESCVPHSAPSASPEDTPVSRLPKTRSYDDLPTSCEGLTPNRRSSDPNLNEWHERRLTLEISVRTEADGNHTQTSERGLNTNLSDELNTDHPENGAELSVTDSQMQNTSQEEHRKLDLLKNIRRNTPEESALNENNQTLELPEELEEKRPPVSQHPLQTNENIELTPDGLLLDNSTITHDSSECSSQSSMESSSSPNHTTLNGVCSPSQHPLFPSSDRDSGSQMSAAGDASPTSPHKHPLGVSGHLSALGHLDKDGLSLHSDAVQVRLRQMEAGHQLQVETLKKQVQELWSRLHVNRKLVRNKHTLRFVICVIARWFSDHAPSRCYGCERTFWLTARKHHCRNCGNVFCASCCDQKVAVSSQQLREHNHVCQACYGHLRPSAVPPALPPADLELEKPIAASSN
uniref:phosphatidylinositol-3,5-bisphosphate 3-phosphatase n=1 Tax=Cyprinus carpio TaxID=7962 RepID=A0A8C2G6J3_CYPCA